MSVVFGVLTDGDHGAVTFDTAGDHDYEMSEIAEAVIGVLGVKGIVKRAAIENNGGDRYLGGAELFRGHRRRICAAPVSFAEQILETSAYLSVAG